MPVFGWQNVSSQEGSSELVFVSLPRWDHDLNQLQGPADKIEEAKPGLRAIVEEPANGVLHSSCVFRAIRLMCDIYFHIMFRLVCYVMQSNCRTFIALVTSNLVL